MTVLQPPIAAAWTARLQARAPWLALIAVYLVWGSTYAGIRVAVHVLPPFTMAGLRYSLAGLILYPLARRRGRRPNARSWALAALIGALLLAGGNGLLSLGEQHVPSGIAALLVATVSLWLIVLERIVRGVRISRGALIGLLGGFAGVAVLVAPSSSVGVPLGGAIAILVASALWATGSLVSRSHPLGVDPILGTAMELLAGGALLLLIGGAHGEWPHLHPAAVNLHVAFAFAWLVVPGTLVAFSAYLYALRTLPTATVATYAYANPVVAVAIGTLLLGEHLHPTTLIAGTIIVAAVALTITDQTRKRQRPRSRGDLDLPTPGLSCCVGGFLDHATSGGRQ